MLMQLSLDLSIISVASLETIVYLFFLLLPVGK